MVQRGHGVSGHLDQHRALGVNCPDHRLRQVLQLIDLESHCPKRLRQGHEIGIQQVSADDAAPEPGVGLVPLGGAEFPHC